MASWDAMGLSIAVVRSDNLRLVFELARLLRWICRQSPVTEPQVGQS